MERRGFCFWSCRINTVLFPNLPTGRRVTTVELCGVYEHLTLVFGSSVCPQPSGGTGATHRVPHQPGMGLHSRITPAAFPEKPPLPAAELLGQRQEGAAVGGEDTHTHTPPAYFTASVLQKINHSLGRSHHNNNTPSTAPALGSTYRWWLGCSGGCRLRGGSYGAGALRLLRL